MTGDADNQKLSEGLVTENLRTLRLLHQILMIVAAAILAFALRSDPASEYRAALTELSTLNEVPFNNWTTFVSQRYKLDHEQNTRFVLGVIRAAGLSILGHPTLNEPVVANQPPSLTASKLIDFDAFLSGVQRIGNLRIGGEKRSAAEQLRKAAAARNANPRVSGMSFSSGGQPSAYAIVDQQSVDPSGPATVSFNINDQPQTIPNTFVSINTTYTLRPESGRFALEWLETEPFGKELVDRRTGVVFPHLKAFWDRVSSLTDDQATVFLQEELSTTTRGTVSFFGIPVETNLAVWAGAAVSLSVMMFLGLHLRQFRSAGCYQPTAVGVYPWVPLFHGFWPLLVTLASVLVLPLIANVVLLRRYGNFTEKSTWVAVGLVGLTFAAALWVLVEISKLRKAIWLAR